MRKQLWDAPGHVASLPACVCSQNLSVVAFSGAAATGSRTSFCCWTISFGVEWFLDNACVFLILIPESTLA